MLRSGVIIGAAVLGLLAVLLVMPSPTLTSSALAQTRIAVPDAPGVDAVIFAVPAGVLGGVTTALYGLIGIIGVRIWIENRVDFSIPRNQFAAGVGLIVAIANYTLTAGQLVFEGIVLGTVATLVIYHLMDALERLRGPRADARDDHAPPAAAPAAPTEPR